VCVCVCVVRVCVWVCKDNRSLNNWHVVYTISECAADTILVTRDSRLMHRSEGNADLLANVKIEKYQNQIDEGFL
jgi:hypothetical protein